jgi:uncharacterized membrane protein YuzA (DUF378 family)
VTGGACRQPIFPWNKFWKGWFTALRVNQEISNMRAINIITLILIIVGGLNWGLVGLFQFDLVAAIFGGQDAALARIVYVLVGISAVWQLIPLMRSFSADEAAAQRYQRD